MSAQRWYLYRSDATRAIDWFLGHACCDGPPDRRDENVAGRSIILHATISFEGNSDEEALSYFACKGRFASYIIERLGIAHAPKADFQPSGFAMPKDRISVIREDGGR